MEAIKNCQRTTEESCRGCLTLLESVARWDQTVQAAHQTSLTSLRAGAIYLVVHSLSIKRKLPCRESS